MDNMVFARGIALMLAAGMGVLLGVLLLGGLLHFRRRDKCLRMTRAEIVAMRGHILEFEAKVDKIEKRQSVLDHRQLIDDSRGLAKLFLDFLIKVCGLFDAYLRLHRGMAEALTMLESSDSCSDAEMEVLITLKQCL